MTKSMTTPEDVMREQKIAGATAAWNNLPAQLLKEDAEIRKQRAVDFEERGSSYPELPQA